MPALRKMKSIVVFLGAAAAVHAADSGSPVERVVNLIKGVRDRAIADGEAEETMYNKYACWCETTAKRKAAAIEQAQADERRLIQSILSGKGLIATKVAEIKTDTADIAAAEDAIAKETSIRKKQNGEYMADSSETKDAIAAMEKAIEVLAKGSSLLQLSDGSKHVRALLELLPASHTVKAQHLSLLSEFASSHDTSRYAPQSATIQGILTDMYATFASDLEDMTSTEATQNTDFEAFIDNKETEIVNLKAHRKECQETKAKAEKQLAEDTAEYDDTKAEREANIEFFDQTQEACQSKSDEWDERKSLRAEEIKGMNEALDVLTSDEARELFAKSIKPGKETMLLQISSDNVMSAPASHAYSVLKKEAAKSHSLRLAMIAVNIRNAKSGHFDQVIASIETIMQTLTEENLADIKKRDECKDQYQEIESTMKDLEWKIDNNDAMIAKLTGKINDAEDEKAATIAEIENVDQQLEDMLSQRKEENTAFKAARSDDASAIELLELAKEKLTAFYKKNKIPVFIQQGPNFAVSDDQAPDATFSDKGKRSGETKGIVSLMTMLIEELNDEIKNDTANEEKTHLEYEADRKSAKKYRAELVDKKTTLEQTIADRTQDRTDEEGDKTSNQGDHTAEVEERAGIQPDCDWIIKNFQKRATARDAEMNGLRTAKEYLAGAKVPSLLQEKKSDEGDALSRIHFLNIRK
jgi:hypothetical protein